MHPTPGRLQGPEVLAAFLACHDAPLRVRVDGQPDLFGGPAEVGATKFALTLKNYEKQYFITLRNGVSGKCDN